MNLCTFMHSYKRIYIHIGTALYRNGDLVEGTFKINLINGPRVTVRYHNGDMYLGGYLNNKRHGKGTLLFKNNDRYEGDFQNDYMHGKGILKLCNGDVYEGMCKIYIYMYLS